ncbi:MAG TPA: hypothetical protein VM348_04635, partial [Brevundimonas sp.]|nr:hypothetical protein [Brevundimonas sp.]
MTDLPPPVAVVAHDAGAANLILAWLAAAPSGLKRVRPVMAGPAAALWAARFPDGPVPVALEAALEEANSLLSGTGWASDLEHEARRLARARGIPSVAVIDHWVNYRMRFQRHGEEILPDRLWVADEHALAEAAASLPEVPAELKPNLYLQEQADAA